MWNGGQDTVSNQASTTAAAAYVCRRAATEQRAAAAAAAAERGKSKAPTSQEGEVADVRRVERGGQHRDAPGRDLGIWKRVEPSPTQKPAHGCRARRERAHARRGATEQRARAKRARAEGERDADGERGAGDERLVQASAEGLGLARQVCARPRLKVLKLLGVKDGGCSRARARARGWGRERAL